MRCLYLFDVERSLRMAVSKKWRILSVNGKKVSLPVMKAPRSVRHRSGTLKKDAGAVVFD